jgi:glyoxylase-like metal-dependent hydrolase (beta-lactamase superfamily II)
MEVTRYYFVASMPNEPGALHRGAEIVQRYEGNIGRIHYDRRIDPNTVFFEVACPEERYREITAELDAIGYLRSSLAEPAYLRFDVRLPDRPGALLDLLDHISASRSNIAFLDFDSAQGKDALSVGLTLEDSSRADDLLRAIRSKYPLEIVEHSTTGDELDDTVFYLRFAQELRSIIPDIDQGFLLALLSDINHIVQSLHRMQQDPRGVFDSILQTARTLRETTGTNFYAHVQKVALRDGWELICIQPPCGGNVFILNGKEGGMMIDSGYGIYHQDLLRTMQMLEVRPEDLRDILITHADADHCGGAGMFDRPSYLSKETAEIIDRSDRAYGSRSQGSILEKVYTKLIDIFSDFNPPTMSMRIKGEGYAEMGGFRVLERLNLLGLEVTVLGSLGGHQAGLVFYYIERLGIIFTADCLFNFDSLTEERRRYNMFAKVLMTSVNVDSERAREERDRLCALVSELDGSLKEEGEALLICGGHGAMSILDDGVLVSYGRIRRY